MRVPDHAQSFYIGSRRQGAKAVTDSQSGGGALPLAQANASSFTTEVLAYENGYGRRGKGECIASRRKTTVVDSQSAGALPLAQANASSFTTEVLASLPLVAEWTGVREWIRQANASSFTTEVLAYENGYGRRGKGECIASRRKTTVVDSQSAGALPLAQANASSFTTEVLASLPLVAEWTGVREWIRQANASSFTTEVLAYENGYGRRGKGECIASRRKTTVVDSQSAGALPLAQANASSFTTEVLAYENGYGRRGKGECIASRRKTTVVDSQSAGALPLAQANASSFTTEVLASLPLVAEWTGVREWIRQRRPMPARLRRRSWRHYPLSQSGLAYENGYGRRGKGECIASRRKTTVVDSQSAGALPLAQANASSFTTEVLASLPLVAEWTGVREWMREVRQR
ncbi:uncharacterized protein LOC144114756 [Amblyomma americanum]